MDLTSDTIIRVVYYYRLRLAGFGRAVGAMPTGGCCARARVSAWVYIGVAQVRTEQVGPELSLTEPI